MASGTPSSIWLPGFWRWQGFQVLTAERQRNFLLDDSRSWPGLTLRRDDLKLAAVIHGCLGQIYEARRALPGEFPHQTLSSGEAAGTITITNKRSGFHDTTMISKTGNRPWADWKFTYDNSRIARRAVSLTLSDFFMYFLFYFEFDNLKGCYMTSFDFGNRGTETLSINKCMWCMCCSLMGLKEWGVLLFFFEITLMPCLDNLFTIWEWMKDFWF